MLSANLFNVCCTGEIFNLKNCICLFIRSSSYFTLLTFVVEVMTTFSKREIQASPLDLDSWLCCSDSHSSPLCQGLEFYNRHTSFQFGEHGDDMWPNLL